MIKGASEDVVNAYITLGLCNVGQRSLIKAAICCKRHYLGLGNLQV